MSQAAPAKQATNRLIATLVIGLGIFLFAYTVPLASPAKEQIAKSLGLASEEDTAPLFTAYLLSWLIVIPPCAYLADRFGRKAMLLTGSLTLAIGMLLTSASTTLPMICGAQFLTGAGAIILQIVGAAAITDLYAEKRGSILNIAVGFVGMVAVSSPFLMGKLLKEGVSWNTVYAYSAILPILVLVLQLFCAFPAAAVASQPITGSTIKELARSPLFLLLIGSMFVYGIIEQGVSIWCSSYAKQLGADADWGGAVVSVYWLAMSIVRAGAGAFRLFENVPHPRMIAINGVLGAIFLAAAIYTDDYKVAVILFGAFGASIAFIWPSIMTYAVTATGKPTTTVFGLVVGLGGSTGAMFGAIILGLIKKQGLTFGQALLTIEIPLLLLAVVFGAMSLRMRAPAVKN